MSAQPQASGKKAQSQISAKSRKLKDWIRLGWESLFEILKSLGSPDRPTRKMALVFILSAIGFVSVLGAMAKRFQDRKSARTVASLQEEEDAGKNLGEFLKRQAEEARQKATLVDLGSFLVELKSMPGAATGKSVLNLAEVDLVLLCDDKDTRDQIQSRLSMVRDQVTRFFSAMDREELLSKDGKKRLKKNVLERLNSTLEGGKVKDVYITRLILS